MKNPLPIGFGARLKELIAEGLPAKEAIKEAWREVKKSRAKTGVYSGSREIFGRKRRKNPKRITVTGFEDETTEDIQVDLHSREVAPPHLRDQKLMAAMREELYRRELARSIKTQKERYSVRRGFNPILISSKSQAQFFVNVLNEKFSVYPYAHIYISTLGGESRASILITISLDPKSEWPNGILENSRYAKFHLEYNGKLEMITGYKVGKMRKVTVKDISDVAAKIFRFLGYPKNPKRNSVKFYHRTPKKRTRKNPIAIYNPPNQKLLYGRAYIPVIRGIKTNGKYKGERYQHNFSKSNEVSIYGNTDGSITVKSNNNIRLWDYDKDI